MRTSSVASRPFKICSQLPFLASLFSIMHISILRLHRRQWPKPKRAPSCSQHQSDCGFRRPPTLLRRRRLRDHALKGLDWCLFPDCFAVCAPTLRAVLDLRVRVRGGSTSLVDSEIVVIMALPRVGCGELCNLGRHEGAAREPTGSLKKATYLSAMRCVTSSLKDL